MYISARRSLLTKWKALYNNDLRNSLAHDVLVLVLVDLALIVERLQSQLHLFLHPLLSTQLACTRQLHKVSSYQSSACTQKATVAKLYMSLP